MSEDPYWRTKELFEQALDRPAGQRQAFLEDACGNDEHLLAELMQMLEAHELAATGATSAAASAAAANIRGKSDRFILSPPCG